MTKKKDYLVIAPHYDRRSSGIKAMYILAHRLNELGYNAYMPANPRESGYNVKSLYSLDYEQLRELQHTGVVVYPDNVVNKNPLQFSNVVRWWLGVTQKAPDNELAFSMSPSHNFQITERYNNLLMLDIEPFFKFPEIENRTKKCFRVGKGSGVPRLSITDSCTEITSSYPVTRKDVASLFQMSSVFYTYDDFTLLILEALLCGCPTVFLGSPVADKEGLRENVLNRYGVWYYSDGPYDLEEMKKEIPKQVELYKELMETSKKELLTFIELTQAMPDNYVEDLGAHTPENPHPWIALHFWPDFFSLFRER